MTVTTTFVIVMMLKMLERCCGGVVQILTTSSDVRLLCCSDVGDCMVYDCCSPAFFRKVGGEAQNLFEFCMKRDF